MPAGVYPEMLERRRWKRPNLRQPALDGNAEIEHPKTGWKRRACQPPRTSPDHHLPARMAADLPVCRASLLLATDIQGEPMMRPCLETCCAMESKIGAVLVACDGTEMLPMRWTKAGGKAVLTKPDHPSGSDRIWEALNVVDAKGEYDAVINLQGDLPMIDPSCIRAAWELLQDAAVDIGTLVTPIRNEEEKRASQIVKAALDVKAGEKRGRALYFSRVAVPSGEGTLYYHVGIYAYHREALARFVATPPSVLELREKLEQLRALSLGMHIDAAIVDEAPFGVDTPEDLEKARKLMVKARKQD